MNGGYALVLGCSRTTAVAALHALAKEEHLQLRDATARSQVVLGVHPRGRSTLVLPGDDVEVELLEAIGSALTAYLTQPILLAIDTDDGDERIRAWQGGEALSPHTGWTQWNHDEVTTRLELVLPAFTVLPRAEARPLLAELADARSDELAELKLRVVEIARRPVRGALAKAIPAWRLAIMIPGAARFHVEVRAASTRGLIKRAMQDIRLALERKRLPAALANRRVALTATELAAIARRLGDDSVELRSMVRSGPRIRRYTKYTAELLVDERRTRVSFEADSDAAEIAEALAAEIADRRSVRARLDSAKLSKSLDELLELGDLESAASAYRKLHAGFFAKLPAVDAMALARDKVQELARLYGFAR